MCQERLQVGFLVVTQLLSLASHPLLQETSLDQLPRLRQHESIQAQRYRPGGAFARGNQQTSEKTQKMAEPFQVIGNTYTNVHTSGGRSHLGNVYNYGSSSDEKALQAILDSLSYLGMKDRRDTLTGPSYQTFQWALKDGPTSFINSRWFDFRDEAQSKSTTVDMTFRTWLEGDDRFPFCFMGKPGSGKSILMYYTHCIQHRIVGAMLTSCTGSISPQIPTQQKS